MKKYRINGGKPLYGDIEISGAKNAAVAIIPAALMVDGICCIENVPQISDVTMFLNIARKLNAGVTQIDGKTFELDGRRLQNMPADFDIMQKIRASYYLIGAMLGRYGEATVAMPGGCNFGGTRPIDQHLKGFRAMGAEITTEGDLVIAKAPGGRLKGAYILLDVVSVGATINLMLAACLAKGRTVIENAAKEPHIVDVANFLNSMGADIRGTGTNVIKIRGVDKLHGGFYSIIPDQIEAGTYLTAVAGTGGEVRVNNVIPRHLECITRKLQEMGVEVEAEEDSVIVRRENRLTHTNVKTQPYPGFPTDMQPQVSTILCTAKGKSTITEGVWDNRYKYVGELEKMGASVRVEGHQAFITGVNGLTGAEVTAWDLRAGAAMVIAGLMAEGTTVISGVDYIERGYENIIEKLQAVGADITAIETDEEA